MPEEPVVFKASGLLFDKRLTEKHILDYGKCPVTGEALTMDDLVPIKAGKVVKPEPLQAASIPGMFQNEWDASVLSSFASEQQPHTTTPETQPPRASASTRKGGRKHKKKETNEPRAEREYTFWSEKDDQALAQAWIVTMEDPQSENWIYTRKWWNHCYETWVTFAKPSKDDTRGKDAVQAHWKSINDECLKYNRIYEKVKNNGWVSVCDSNIQAEALTIYRTEGQPQGRQGKPFKYMDCWKKLQACNKWPQELTLPRRSAASSRAPKRSKTSSLNNPSTPATPSDAHNFNPVDEDDENKVNLGEDDVQELPHPRRKNKGKMAEGSSSTRAGEDLDQLKEMFCRFETTISERFADLQAFAEKDKQMDEMMLLRQMNDDVAFFRQMGLEADAKALEEQRVEKLRKFYNLPKSN